MKTHFMLLAFALVLAGGCVSRKLVDNTATHERPAPALSAKTVEVKGTVIRAGVYPWRKGMTLMQVLASAGGVTEYAGSVTISRADQIVTYSMKQLRFGADLPVVPGDTILVDPRRAH